MRRSLRLVITILAFLVPSGLAHAADLNSRPPRLGEIWLGNPTISSPYIEAFRDGLKAQGFEEGRNISIVARFAEGDPKRMPALVEELVAMKVDVLLGSPKAFGDAMRATSTIPIVSMGFADPVAEGIVTNIAKPGGNVTGVSWQSSDTVGKRLQLAREVATRLRRVAVLFDPKDSRVVDARALLKEANRAIVDAKGFEVNDPAQGATVLRAVTAYKPDVLIVTMGPTTLMLRDSLRDFGITNRIPVISEGRVMAGAGILVTYGPNDFEIMRRAAVYVGRILNGAKPSELPIEQPMKLELIVNMKTAQAMGLRIPDTLLQSADEVLR